MATASLLDRMPGIVTPDDAAELCTAVLGADLTAYLAGAGSVDELHRWRRDPAAADPLFCTRVAAAADVVDTFAAYNRISLAGAWLRGVDPQLGIPARVLRFAAADRTAIKDLVAAATAAASA